MQLPYCASNIGMKNVQGCPNRTTLSGVIAL